MDETIGIKGGHQDTIRTMRIQKEQRKKLEELREEQEIAELEQEVKKKQRYILVRVLPIAIAGEVFRVLYDTATGRNRIDKQEEYSKWRIKEYDADFTTKARNEPLKTKEVVVVLLDGRKVRVKVPVIEEKVIEVKKPSTTVIDPKVEDLKEPVVKKQPAVEVKQTSIPIPVTALKPEEKKEEEKSNDTLKKLKNRKIIDEYEKQLKDVRYELRKLIFEYNVLVGEGENLLLAEEAERILDRLSEVIRKIEILKEKIQIENLEQYDDNYIYVLIEDYLKEFHDKRMVSELKDSPLYILISEKIDEISTKKDAFQKEVEDQKKVFEEREKRFDELKEKYYNLDKVNQELEKFQAEQEQILKVVQEKIRNSVDVKERVEVQVQAMNQQSRRMLRMLTLSMFLPGNRAARRMAATTAAYLYFARQILNPPTVTRRYKVITVYDYSKDIEYNLEAISDANDLLKKTDKQLDRIIAEIRADFKDYIGVLPECDELLANLEKVKSNLHEKEYEMEKTKKEQEHMLELNNAKVLTRGTYPM